MNPRIIEILNQARSAELGAISQYMIHHYELEDAGFSKLATKIKEVAIAEMKHAEKLAERILLLKGEATFKPDLISQKGQDIAQILATDVGLEKKAIQMYNEAAVMCAAEKDAQSKDLFEELIADEEEHLHLFENFKRHIDKMGAAYLATLIQK